MPGLTPRQQQLSSLAAQMPLQNQQLAKQQQATQAIQMQQALGQAPASSNVRGVAAAFGAQQAQQQGRIQAGLAQQTSQQLAQVQSQQNQELSRANTQALQEKSAANKRIFSSLNNQLSDLSERVKSDVFDRQTQFKTDELGRTYWNERQLADWKISQAKSDEELYNYMQEVEQVHAIKMQMLQAAQAKIQQELKQAYEAGETEKNNEQTRALFEADIALKEKIRKQQARAQQNAMILSSGMSIAGGIAGALIAGPGGYAAGASLGMAVGSAAGNLAAGQGAKAV